MTDIASVRELLRRAILTLAVIEDPERRFRGGPKTLWPPFAQWEAYGVIPASPRLFEPTPADISRYLDVLDWLTWYERQHGSETIRLFRAWMRDKPKWWLEEICITQWGQPARCRKTVIGRLNDMYAAIATHFKDELLRYRIDGFPEFPQIGPNHLYGQNCAESDLRTLPTSPKAWISAIPEPLSPSAEARAHKLLTKRFERNRMAALRRKQQAYAAA